MNIFFKTITVCAFVAVTYSIVSAESINVRFDSGNVFNTQDGIDVKWTAAKKPEFVEIKGCKSLRDVFGLSASVKIGLADKFKTENWRITFSWAPYNNSFSWPKGQLLAINTDSGKLVLGTLSRGRLAARLDGKIIGCTHWLNWKYQTFKKVSLVKKSDLIYLFINGNLKFQAQITQAMKLKSLDIATPVGQPMLCSGGYWESFEISNNPVLPISSATLTDHAKSLALSPYPYRILRSKTDLVSRLEKLRVIDSSGIADTDLKAKLTVLQVAWDAWLCRMTCRDWDKWENKNPDSKVWFAKALAQLKKMTDDVEAERKSVQKNQSPKSISKLTGSGPWKIQKGRIFRNDKAELYQGFIGWTMGYAIDDIANMGGNLVSISVWPEMLYDKDGKFREAKWQEVIGRTMVAAQANNIAVDMLITAYPTKPMLKANPAWDKTCGHSFLKACVLDEKYNEFAKQFLSDSLVRLKSYPALASICIGNELQFDEHCPASQKRFQTILKKEFKTIAAFNKQFSTNFKSFNAITVSKDDIHKSEMPAWVRYWRQNMWEIGNEHVAELIKTCKACLPEIPVHVKILPNEFTRPSLKPGSWRWKWKWDHWDFPDGIDRPSLVNMLDMAGTDSWAAGIQKRSDYDFIREDDVMYQQMYYDYLTGLDSDKPIFDSEWHVLNGHWPMPAKQYRRTAWLGVTSGVQAASLWVWHPTIERITALTQPALLNEVSKFFIELQQSKSLVNELRENRFATIAMIYAHHLCRENQNSYITAMLSAYRQLVFMGQRPVIIDTRNLKHRGIPKDTRVIISILPPGEDIDAIAKDMPQIKISWPVTWQRLAAIDPEENIIDARKIYEDEKKGKFNSRFAAAVKKFSSGIKDYSPVHGIVPLKDSNGRLRMLINIMPESKTVESPKIELEPFEVRFIESNIK